MTLVVEAHSEHPGERFLVQDRLVDLGVRDPRHRHRLLTRLERERRPDETLAEAYTRSLCRCLGSWLERLGAPPLGEGTAALAAAEAALALSGIAERWPQALLDPAANLPPEACRRLRVALPLATPPIMTRAMPAQSLEPVALPVLLSRPRRVAPVKA